MYRIVPSKQFKKDFKRAARSGRFDLPLFNEIVNFLAKGEPLDKKHKDHDLQGSMQDFRECHVKPDLLLVYKIYQGQLILELVRLGSHSELFD